MDDPLFSRYFLSKYLLIGALYLVFILEIPCAVRFNNSEFSMGSLKKVHLLDYNSNQGYSSYHYPLYLLLPANNNFYCLR